MKIKGVVNWLCVNGHQFFTFEEENADKPICPWCGTGKIFRQASDDDLNKLFGINNPDDGLGV